MPKNHIAVLLAVIRFSIDHAAYQLSRGREKPSGV
jgi:hypothetical protein